MRLLRTLGLRAGFVRAMRLGALGVQLQRVLANRKAAFRGDTDLALLDLGGVELFDAPALNAHQMVVVAAFIELEHRLVGLEVVALEYTGLLELREEAADRSEAFVHALAGVIPL